MKIDAKGLALLKEFEGCRLVAYQCSAGVWTIGWGCTKGVEKGDALTQTQADERLLHEIGDYEAGVMSACQVTPNQNQFSALVVFSWNVGIGGMKGSSVIKAYNRGDVQAAARAFGLWNKAGGKPVAGLTRRRAAESVLFLEPVDGAQDMPQIVEPESKLTASPINRASVIAGGTAALASANEIITAISDVKDGVAGLGEWLLPVALVAIVIACGYVIYTRWLQRKNGWA